MCEIYLGDCDPVAGHRILHRTARKEHRCECCRAPIKVGDLYHYASWINADRRPDWERACMLCALDCKEFGDAHRLWFFVSSFCEYLDECVVGDQGYANEDSEKWRPMLERIEARRKANA